MKKFRPNKTVVLTNEEKKKLSSELKSKSLSREEMERLVVELERSFDFFDREAARCSKNYQEAVDEKKVMSVTAKLKRKKVKDEAQSRLNNINSQKIGLINTIFNGNTYKERKIEIENIINKVDDCLKEIQSWENSEIERINRLINKSYELEGKEVGGGKYWYAMRYRAATEKFKISELKKLISKIKKDEKILELKASASDNNKKTRSLASPVKARIIQQFKISELCPYCGEKIDPQNSHADHIYPVSKGGRSSPKNMVYICSGCNLSKGNKTLNQFIKENNLQRDIIENNLELLNKDF